MALDKKAIPLQTGRLKLERLTSKFCSLDYVSWMNDLEVIKYLDSGGDYTLEKLKNYLQIIENQDILFWAIIDKLSNKHIGNIKIDPVSSLHKRGEYGILIGNKESWGKGYAKEASQAVINYCFSHLNFKKITLGVVDENEVALTLYKKMGFIQEGLMKAHGYYNGGFQNVVRMAIFNDGFENNET